MSLFTGLMKLFGMEMISASEVRAESWALGCRHGGRVVEGARSELRERGLPFRRSLLLQAVIESHPA